MDEREDGPPVPPQETINDWLRFIAARPGVGEITTWLTVRAMEIKWDFYELSMALMVGVKKAELVETKPDEPLPQ